jgi:hypothetical protein
VCRSVKQKLLHCQAVFLLYHASGVQKTDSFHGATGNITHVLFTSSEVTNSRNNVQILLFLYVVNRVTEISSTVTRHLSPAGKK